MINEFFPFDPFIKLCITTMEGSLSISGNAIIVQDGTWDLTGLDLTRSAQRGSDLTGLDLTEQHCPCSQTPQMVFQGIAFHLVRPQIPAALRLRTSFPSFPSFLSSSTQNVSSFSTFSRAISSAALVDASLSLALIFTQSLLGRRILLGRPILQVFLMASTFYRLFPPDTLSPLSQAALHPQSLYHRHSVNLPSPCWTACLRVSGRLPWNTWTGWKMGVPGRRCAKRRSRES